MLPAHKAAATRLYFMLRRIVQDDVQE